MVEPELGPYSILNGENIFGVFVISAYSHFIEWLLQERQTDSSTAYQEMNSNAVPYLLCVTESFIRSSMALVLHCYQDKQEIIIRSWQY